MTAAIQPDGNPALAKGQTMTCPHCGVHTRIDADSPHQLSVRAPAVAVGTIGVQATVLFCTHCKEPLVGLTYLTVSRGPSGHLTEGTGNSRLVFPPLRSQRPPPPAEVPADIAADYNEAAACEPHSARAAAVLARRCLQGMLTDKGYVGKDLLDQLASALNDQRMPTDLHGLLDLVRQVGNYSAHPITDRSTGIVLNVEEAELDALFGTLAEAFDVFYVKPRAAKATIDLVNRKLQAAHKPAIGVDPNRRAEAAAKKQKP